MIRFENVTIENLSSASFEIKEGSVCKIITNSEHQKKVFLNTILALQKPIDGKVFLFGRDIHSISEKESFKIFKKIGMVWRDGGIISNLKVWENITLPIWYHMGERPENVEDRVIDIFKEMGEDVSELSEYMKKLPGPLPVHEKRLIGMVRAMLMEPELMIYDSIFEGLNPEMAERLVRLTTKFHSEKPGRTSVYISSDEQSLKDVKADIILKQHGKGFIT
ncbi:MAG: ATP-binding cassette domain-containing protein [Nitrospirota bacterium]